MERDEIVRYWTEGHISKVKEFRQWILEKINS